MAKHLVLVTLWGLFFTSCTGESRPPPFRHQAFYEALQQYAESFTLLEGDWKEDFGDAAFYGPGFYVQVGKLTNNLAYLERARVAHERNLRVLREQSLLTGDANEIIMAALGVVEYLSATGDRQGLSDLNRVLADLNLFLQLSNYYVPAEAVPGYAMTTYGPTSVNGLLALVNLQHALLLGDENRARYLEVGRQIASALRQRAWTGSYYRFSDARPDLYLYPNVTMILLNGRLYQLTGEASYRDQALATYRGIQPLRVTSATGWVGPGRYRSPYSAQHMGARTDDYTTLSSQNYLMFALSVLYQITKDPRYVAETDTVLTFAGDYLLGTWRLSDLHRGACQPACPAANVCVAETCLPDAAHPGVLHHWMDGRLALPSDPEFFCSGCNLQLLYVMWYRQFRIDAG
jgi:hypothetical protein